MKGIITICALLCSLYVNGQGQNIRLIINTPFNTPSGDKVYITGDFPGCSWRPNCFKVTKLSDNKYEALIPFDSSFSMKVTRGSFNRQAADSRGRALQNLYVDRSKSKEIKIVDVKNWLDLGPLKAVGTIKRIKNFYSPELKNYRDLQIRLPDDYYTSNKRYPVLYMHDGQNCFDPNTASFGTDWSVDDVLSDLVKRGEVRDAIVVGVYHKNRGSEYNDEDRGDLYGEFLVNTLKSYIDSNFRTLTDRDNTFLMGSSFGSAISVSLSWRFSHIFGRAAGLAFNASFFNDALFRMIETFPLTTTKLYLDHGSRGGDQRFGPHAKRFLKRLEELGMPKSQYDYRFFDHTNHTETDWARRVHIPLKFLLK